jgi:hypothetical protein
MKVLKLSLHKAVWILFFLKVINQKLKGTGVVIQEQFKN